MICLGLKVFVNISLHPHTDTHNNFISIIFFIITMITYNITQWTNSFLLNTQRKSFNNCHITFFLFYFSGQRPSIKRDLVLN